MLWNETEKTYINLKLIAVVWPVEDIKRDAPKFIKLDKEFKPIGETFTKVSGKLSWVKKTFTPKKGKMWDIYWFKAFLDQEDGSVVVIESTITNASKDLLNALLANKGKQIEISLYLNKNKYPTSSVREAGEFVPTYVKFNEIDTIELFNSIEKVFVKDEDDEVNQGSDDINIEDIPFS